MLCSYVLYVNFSDHFNISMAGDIILSKPVNLQERAIFDLVVVAFDGKNKDTVSQTSFLAYSIPMLRRHRCRPPFSYVFFSKTARPIKAKFYVEPPWEGGTKVYLNVPGLMTKMAAMPIYGKNLKKSQLIEFKKVCEY